MTDSPRLPDSALLARCRSGNRDAFGEFYVRHREEILGFLLRRVRGPEQAADLMAETFASALGNVLQSERPLPDVPAAWLHTIARNLVVDSVRRGRVEDEARRRLGMGPLVLDDEDLARIAEISAAHSEVQGAIGQLAEPDAALLHARVVDEEPYADLAARMQCSEAVVRKRVSRAKAHLRSALGGTHA